MASEKPRGILRNRDEAVKSRSGSVGERIDRREVIENTKLNAQLASESSKGEELRAKIAAAKKAEGDEHTKDEHLKWDEVNLYKTEQEKCSTMKIDEPKTPYSGGFNPEGEYYREDDEEEAEIPSFSLGEGEFETAKQNAAPGGHSLNGGEVLKHEDGDGDGEPEEEPEQVESAEDRHKRFEEMRKAHYHLKGSVLKKGYHLSDEEEGGE